VLSQNILHPYQLLFFINYATLKNPAKPGPLRQIIRYPFS